MKRVNVLVTEDFLHAVSVREFLDENGIGAKHVTKHAVQVLPSQIDQVTALNPSYPAWVEGKDRKAMESSKAA